MSNNGQGDIAIGFAAFLKKLGLTEGGAPSANGANSIAARPGVPDEVGAAADRSNQGALDQASTQTQNEPVGATGDLAGANQQWKDAKKVKFIENMLVIKLSISGPMAADIAKAIQIAWDGKTVSDGKTTYTTDVKITAVAEGGDIAVETDRSIVNAKNTDGYTKFVGGQADDIPSSHFRIPPVTQGPQAIDPRFGTPKPIVMTSAQHEFGHMLGLNHALNETHSIMSYDESRALQWMDLNNLRGGYGDDQRH